MSSNTPPPPKIAGEVQFNDWLFRFWKSISAAASGGVTSHTELQNLNTDSHTHLTQSQAEDLTDLGNSTIHYHSADRARANHTGEQLSTTISDFEDRVRGIVGESSDSILENQVFGG